jgi:hypothetical protein
VGHGLEPAGELSAVRQWPKEVITWAVRQRIGLLVAGDPRVVLGLSAGRRHSQQTRDWRVGRFIIVLRDKAETAGIAPWRWL